MGGAKNPRDFSGKIETFHSCSCCYHFCLVHFINYCMRTMFVVSSAHLLKVSLKVSSILNWIQQLLLCHCSKQQKYRNLTVYWTKYIFFLPFSLVTASCASFVFLSGRCFSVLGHSIQQNFKSHKWSFVP